MVVVAMVVKLSNTFDQAIPVHQLSDLTLRRISNGSNITNTYRLYSNFFYQTIASVYRVNIEERFDADDINFIDDYDSNDTSLTLEISKKQ